MQKSAEERLGRQLERQTSSLLRNSTPGGNGALHAPAASFSSAASRELSEAAGDLTKVVIDISNPIAPPTKGLTIGHSTAEAALSAYDT